MSIPVSTPINTFAQYSDDGNGIDGNASPFFLTENGSRIDLYKIYVLTDLSEVVFSSLSPAPTVTITANPGVKILKRTLSVDQNIQLDVSGWTNGSMVIMTITNSTGVNRSVSIPSGHYPENVGLIHPIPLNAGERYRVVGVFDGSIYTWNWTKLDAPV